MVSSYFNEQGTRSWAGPHPLPSYPPGGSPPGGLPPTPLPTLNALLLPYPTPRVSRTLRASSYIVSVVRLYLGRSVRGAAPSLHLGRPVLLVSDRTIVNVVVLELVGSWGLPPILT
jgi:hypothetical protein